MQLLAMRRVDVFESVDIERLVEIDEDEGIFNNGSDATGVCCKQNLLAFLGVKQGKLECQGMQGVSRAQVLAKRIGGKLRAESLFGPRCA